MKKLKIFLYHTAVFIVGSVGIVIYVFNRLIFPLSGAGVGGVIVMPVITFIYVVIFGVFCATSLIIWLLVSYFSNRNTNPK